MAIIASDQRSASLGLKVTDISQADGSVDAVAVASIDDHLTFKLTFKRYDSGWKWESSEYDGTKLTSDATINVLLERARRKRVREWAEPLLASYTITANTMHWLHGNMARGKADVVDKASWNVRHAWMLDAFEHSNRTPAERAELIARVKIPVDAWGEKIIWILNGRSAYIASMGPDKKIDTPDDLVGQLTGVLEWDPSYREDLWNYVWSWRVPEGLESAVAEYIAPKDRGTVETVRIVQ